MTKILTIAARALEKTPEKMFFFALSLLTVVMTFKIGYLRAMIFLIVVCGAYVYVRRQKFLDKSDERKYQIDQESLRLQRKYLNYMKRSKRKKEDKDD